DYYCQVGDSSNHHGLF
nr:immunoglobulin light chain junction region [Macaca mulatta]MOX17673.1 immunoglobulin light chain junction region [Macaca mulatta]MOX18502.1 immunoglobulin light chain junction region [Macaca mulatta]MOX20227.1 immunoglobulin light chain junction region [Macaca mulatta]MOX21011.1 immunoglobulin light chain junction region [Macaca mulatta]